MIDWLQQHWPWVVLVAVAPILWGLVPLAFQLAWEIICLPFVTLAALNRWLIRVSTPPPRVDEEKARRWIEEFHSSGQSKRRRGESAEEWLARIERTEASMRDQATERRPELN